MSYATMEQRGYRKKIDSFKNEHGDTWEILVDEAGEYWIGSDDSLIGWEFKKLLPFTMTPEEKEIFIQMLLERFTPKYQMPWSMSSSETSKVTFRIKKYEEQKGFKS